MNRQGSHGKNIIFPLWGACYVFCNSWVGSEKETGQDIQDLKASHGFCFEIGGGGCRVAKVGNTKEHSREICL